MNTVILIPYEFIDNYVKNDRLVLKDKSYTIIKTVGKDTYIEVTYRLE
jgi:hypothetical protein